MTRVGRHLPVTQRPGRFQQPIERVSEFCCCRRPTGGSKIPLCVIHRARQYIELVVESIEFVLGDDELVLTELQLRGALAANPLPLTAGL